MKALKPDYFVLVSERKGRFGLTSYGVDAVLLKYINGYNSDRKKLYAKLDELQINYLILDGINETFVHEYDKNNYGEYVYTAMLSDFFTR